MLAFTKTTGYRHASIPAAIAALQKLGTQNGFAVDQTEDAGAFTDANLAQYQVVVFLLTTGDVLDDDQQAALQRFVEAGHGWVGVHSAADTEYDWPWYGGLLGAYFESHPAIQQATLTVDDPTNPSTGAAAREVDAHRRVVRLPDEPAAGGARAAHDRRDDVRREPARRWAPTTRSRGGTTTTAGARSTPRSGTPRSRTPSRSSSRTCSAGSSGPPASRRRGSPSLATALRGRRVVVTATHPACACDATVRVAGPRPRRDREGAAIAATTRVTTPALPAGRWTLTVTLTSRTTGATATARRSVTVR